jgi:hypothetical protein
MVFPQRLVREYARERLGISDLTNITQWPCPDINRAQDFNSGHSNYDGPTIDDLRIDWYFNRVTPWTMRCANIFAQDLMNQLGRGSFPLLQGPYSVDIVAAAFNEHIIHLKNRYSRAHFGTGMIRNTPPSGIPLCGSLMMGIVLLVLGYQVIA